MTILERKMQKMPIIKNFKKTSNLAYTIDGFSSEMYFTKIWISDIIVPVGYGMCAFNWGKMYSHHVFFCNRGRL